MENIKRGFKIKSPSHIGKALQGHLAALLFGEGGARPHKGTWALGHPAAGAFVLFLHWAVSPDPGCEGTSPGGPQRCDVQTQQGFILTY